MRRRILDVSLESIPRLPTECLESCFWELADEVGPSDARFHKEEWFSMTLLEWGRCGKLAELGDEVQGFVQYAPPSLFPGLGRFPSGRTSEDAIYLATCYLVPSERRKGLGTQLVRAVARDLVDRGYRAVEALGDRDPHRDPHRGDGSVLPSSFLAANGFALLREDPRYPLLRLDLRATVEPETAMASAAMPVPSPAFGMA